MKTVERKITLQEFLDMMEKNGYKKGRGGYIFYKHENGLTGASSQLPTNIYGMNPPMITRACAIGQAALNMNIPPITLEAALRDFAVNGQNIADEIIHLNDKTGASVPEIAQKMKAKYADRLADALELLV